MEFSTDVVRCIKGLYSFIVMATLPDVCLPMLLFLIKEVDITPCVGSVGTLIVPLPRMNIAPSITQYVPLNRQELLSNDDYNSFDHELEL